MPGQKEPKHEGAGGGGRQVSGKEDRTSREGDKTMEARVDSHDEE